jgi:hypothetical protein
MIPAFDSSGNLPAGIHEATLDEFEARFATTILRRQLFEKLLKLITDLKAIGCAVVYVDGSYVTNKRLPGDYDACWDHRSVDPIKFALYPGLDPINRAIQKHTYGGDVFPAFIVEGGSGKLFIDFFQTDKNTGLRKGIVELKIV